MTGTQNHECIAGVGAAVDYLHDVGVHSALRGDRRTVLVGGMKAIQKYETELGKHLLEGLAKMSRIKVWGITDLQKLAWRVPTISITIPGVSAETLAKQLAAHDIFTWSGNLYAVNLSERLGLEEHGGFLRLGLVHYNTHEDVDRVLYELGKLA